MNWKITRDKYYAPLYDKYGMQFIERAGFFFDTAKENYDINDSLDIMSTPLNFLMPNINKPRPCVLLTSGSFNPIHLGHMEMLLKSKEYLEKCGWNVIGGYFAPDHDEYISSKLKDEAIPIYHRIKIIDDAIKDIEWLSVDPWAGLFQPCAVNFTDIVERLRRYIKRHVGIEIPVIYVCGGDNAKFAKTFLDQGYCAVVERPGYDFNFSDSFNSKNRLLDILNERFFIVRNNNESSSTAIRKISKWKNIDKNVIIRYSDNPSELEEAILCELEKKFKNVKTVQYEWQERHMHSLREHVVTIDPYTTSIPSKLEISREYDFMGIKKLGYINRPGSLSFEEQMKNWRVGGSVILHDDDIFSGGTMRFAEEVVRRNGYEVISTMSYVRSDYNDEVIDVRDFIYGAAYGGLVVKHIDGTHGRYPYIYPYVCPFMRSSIEDPMEFSIRIWELNRRYSNHVDVCDKNINLLKKFVYAE